MSNIGREQAFATALREMESGIRHDGLWAMSFSEAMGEEAKAKALYLAKRADELMRVNEKDSGVEEGATIIRNQGLLSCERDTKGFDDLGMEMWTAVQDKKIQCNEAVLTMYSADSENEKRFQNRITESEIFVMEGELFWFLMNPITSSTYIRLYNPTEGAIERVLFLYTGPQNANYFFCNLVTPLPPKQFGLWRTKMPFNWFLRHGSRRECEIIVKGAR